MSPLQFLCALLAILPALGLAADLSAPVFLVARPNLPDPNFRDAVVLLTQHGEGGSIGVIVNRPTQVPVVRAIAELEGLATTENVYAGGPVERARVVFMYRPPVAPQGVPEILPGVYFSSKRDLLRGVLEQERSMNGVRVYMGLAGWSQGQLQFEIDRGDWRLVPADARSVFNPRPETLWRELDRRASQTPARLSKYGQMK